MPFLKFSIGIFVSFFTGLCCAEITCDAVGEAAKKIYTGIYSAQAKSQIAEGKALTKAFWYVYKIAPDCPAVKRYAQPLISQNLLEDAPDEPYLKSFCSGGRCSAAVFGGSGGSSGGPPGSTGITQGDNIIIFPLGGNYPVGIGRGLGSREAPIQK